jgi:hypothetical protein
VDLVRKYEHRQRDVDVATKFRDRLGYAAVSRQPIYAAHDVAHLSWLSLAGVAPDSPHGSERRSDRVTGILKDGFKVHPNILGQFGIINAIQQACGAPLDAFHLM